MSQMPVFSPHHHCGVHNRLDDSFSVAVSSSTSPDADGVAVVRAVDRSRILRPRTIIHLYGSNNTYRASSVDEDGHQHLILPAVTWKRTSRIRPRHIFAGR